MTIDNGRIKFDSVDEIIVDWICFSNKFLDITSLVGNCCVWNERSSLFIVYWIREHEECSKGKDVSSYFIKIFIVRIDFYLNKINKLQLSKRTMNIMRKYYSIFNN